MKRLLDIVAAACALVVLSPVLLVIAVMVRVRMGSPVVFAQDRPGMGGTVFRMYKFRTMRDATGPDGQPLPDEDRMTSLGSTLRSTSLDELPEFWNVLKGDMSLVGPRPLLVRYLPRFTAEQARRHEVRPGITGWAQVNGRNALEWDDRLALDVWYVDNRSMGLDLKIMWKTVAQVLGRHGVSAEGHATMPEFKGRSDDE